jgi:hypothetical protein
MIGGRGNLWHGQLRSGWFWRCGLRLSRLWCCGLRLGRLWLRCLAAVEGRHAWVRFGEAAG